MPVTTFTTLACRPTNNVAANATVTYTVGTTASTGYDKSKLVDKLADYPAKITPSAGAGNIRFTFAAAQTIEVIQIIMANLAGATWYASNAAGLSLSQSFPAATLDGFPKFPYLRATGSNSSTEWNIGFTGAPSTAIIGEIALWACALTLPIQFGSLTHGLRYPLIEHQTEYGTPLIYKMGIRERPLEAVVTRESQRAVLFQLVQDAEGRGEPWYLILDDTENDSMMVRFRDVSFMAQRESPQSPMTVTVDEVGLGLAP